MVDIKIKVVITLDIIDMLELATFIVYVISMLIN